MPNRRGETIFEFDAVAPTGAGAGVTEVPPEVFAWLERTCLQTAERGEASWLRLTQRRGRHVVQVTSYVGVMRSPSGFQLEVLPKLGRAIGGGASEARRLLIDMLKCLPGFRHIRTESAHLLATKMPLLEVFITEFLSAVEHVVKRGLRRDYEPVQSNCFALRGKLLVAQQLRQNLHRPDRFFTDHDEFSPNRPENRLLHAALRIVLSVTTADQNQRLARELSFVFADVPPSTRIREDLQRVRIDRGMAHYEDAIAWARLIFQEESPLTGTGANDAPSLLFPMDALFEAFVAKHLARQLQPLLVLKTQSRQHHLVRHQGVHWFRLKPDLLVREAAGERLVLDTKWKLIDSRKSSGAEKYGLAQADFYQLQAYGQSYLRASGDVVLVYPRTEVFDQALPVFEFSHAPELRLWVAPFCLKTRTLRLPATEPFASIFLDAA
jgi:5-methylcytosine-specific restriction enzyme subunit McrC